MHGEKIISHDLQEQNQEYSLEKLLSMILAEFSQLLSCFHKLYVLRQKQQEYLAEQSLKDAEYQLKSSWFSQKIQKAQIASIYEFVPSSAIILKRFRCRLVEVILPCKQRLSSSVSGNILSQTLHRLEKQIYRFEGGLSIKEFLLNISNIFGLHLLAEKEVKTNGVENPEKIILSKELINLDNSIRKSVSRSKTSYEDSSHHRKMKKQAILYFRILSDVRGRFSTIECVGLDFNHFKSSFFQAKNHPEDLYQQYLERNKTIGVLIKNYSKDFKEYLKRKEKRKMEKRLHLLTLEREKLRDYAASKSTNNHLNFTNQSSGKRNSLNPFKTKKDNTEGDLTPISSNKSKRLSFVDKNIEKGRGDESPQKTQLKMKKIIITSSKFRLISEDQSPNKTVVQSPLKQISEGLRKKLKNEKKLLINNLPQLCFRNKY